MPNSFTFTWRLANQVTLQLCWCKGSILWKGDWKEKHCWQKISTKIFQARMDHSSKGTRQKPNKTNKRKRHTKRKRKNKTKKKKWKRSKKNKNLMDIKLTQVILITQLIMLKLIVEDICYSMNKKNILQRCLVTNSKSTQVILITNN